MTTYNELVTYFETMPALIPGIKGVTVGADEEIFTLQNTRIKYPHLWVETPAIRFTGTDENPAIRFDLALNLIANEGRNTNPAANSKLNETLNLLTLLYAQLLADSDNDLFDLLLQPNAGDPIRKWSADNAYGWRLEVVIEIQRLECGPPVDVWEPAPITGDTYEYTIPAGHLLLAVYVKSDAAQTVKVGTSAGADDIGGETYAPADTSIIFSGLNLYSATDTVLYFSGLEGTNTVKVWSILK